MEDCRHHRRSRRRLPLLLLALIGCRASLEPLKPGHRHRVSHSGQLLAWTPPAVNCHEFAKHIRLGPSC